MFLAVMTLYMVLVGVGACSLAVLAFGCLLKITLSSCPSFGITAVRMEQRVTVEA